MSLASIVQYRRSVVRRAGGMMGRVFWLCLAGLGLVACRPIVGPPTPGPGFPVPVEIRYGDHTGEQPLSLDDATWRALEPGLVQVLGSIEAQARTFFDAERFAAEVATVPHVLVRYDQASEFTGREFTWRALELTLVVVGDEPMLLARASATDDWSVYLPADRQAIPAWIGQVQTHVAGD